MTMPRRNFLRDAFRSTLSVGLILAAGRAGFSQQSGNEIPLDAQKDPVFLFRESTFKPYLNGIFQAPNARGEMIEMRLVRIKKYDTSRRSSSRTETGESFGLIFKAEGELPPFTSIHTISHPALGKFDLFLTHRKTEEGELYYEAVINHAQ